jgi:tetratricopeptide (TPR) repeat protein
MADRYTYVPLIGLSIIVAWGVPDILGKWRIKSVILAILSAIILSALTLCTGFQIRYWKNSIALFEHAKNVTQNNYVAYHKLGDAMLAEGQVDTAIKYYSEAIRIKPDFIPARINMGVALRKDGKLEKALDQLSKALSFKKNFAAIHYEIGLTLGKIGRSDEAIKHFREVLRIDPDHAKAYNNLGVVFARQGENKEAIDSFYEAIRIDTRYASAYYNLGKIFAKKRMTQKAIINYRKALDFDTDMTPALYNLSWILASHEDKKYRNGEDAVMLAERLCNITQYNDPLALDALAAAYAESGKFGKAVLTAKKAQKIAVDQEMKHLSLRLRNRLRLYQVGRPYRQTLTTESSQQYD